VVAIAIVLVLGGYGTGLMGYSLVRGYDMTLGSFWNPVHPGKWNTSLYTGTSVFPDGKTQGTSASSGSPTPNTTPGQAICPPGYYMPLNSTKCVKIAAD
jgi:hypothetical protein